MSLSLGKSKDKSRSQSGPLFNDTGYSTVEGTKIRIDPTIRSLQDQALGDYASIYGDVGNATDRFLTNTKSLRDKFVGNEGAFMTARLNPIREATARTLSTAQQDLGRRRVGGSSFGYDTLRSIRSRGAQEESDAAALATNDSANFLANLNAQELQALNQQAQMRASLTGESLQVARDRLLQEMQTLSLGTQGSASGSQTAVSGKGNVMPPGFSLFG